jgi:choline-sulfatase
MEQMSKTPPNIVLIMADQLAPQFTGAYGHPIVKTPHLDALAARGARFDAAYCNSPLCAPSRFSFMSGQLVSRIGAYDNACEFPAAIPTFAHYLNAAGYRTCLSGKMHFVGPDQKHGFTDRVTTDIYPSDFAWTPNWSKPLERIDKWYHNMSTVQESGMAMASYQIDYDDEVDYAANRWLMNRARDKAAGNGQPFCLVASFIHPHDPYVARPEWWDLYDDAEIDMPVTQMAPDEHDPFARRVLDGIEASDVELTDDEIRAARRAYYANVSYFDSKIGALVKTLEETDALDNTIIIVTADHGDMLGERNLWYKMTFFERSVRVPMVMAGPGIVPGEIANACSVVDLLPTFLDIAGQSDMTLAQAVDGRSLLPLAQGNQEDTSEAIAEYLAEMAADPVFMIRRGDMKYIHCDLDPPQLYDVISDPEERRNLADDPAYAEVAKSFADEVQSRWNINELRDKIHASQQSRLTLHAAMDAAPGTHWDYNPPSDASQQYVRNHIDWTVAATRYRYPPV